MPRAVPTLRGRFFPFDAEIRYFVGERTPGVVTAGDKRILDTWTGRLDVGKHLVTPPFYTDDDLRREIEKYNTIGSGGLPRIDSLYLSQFPGAQKRTLGEMRRAISSGQNAYQFFDYPFGVQERFDANPTAFRDAVAEHPPSVRAELWKFVEKGTLTEGRANEILAEIEEQVRQFSENPSRETLDNLHYMVWRDVNRGDLPHWKSRGLTNSPNWYPTFRNSPHLHLRPNHERRADVHSGEYVHYRVTSVDELIAQKGKDGYKGEGAVLVYLTRNPFNPMRLSWNVVGAKGTDSTVGNALLEGYNFAANEEKGRVVFRRVRGVEETSGWILDEIDAHMANGKPFTGFVGAFKTEYHTHDGVDWAHLKQSPEEGVLHFRLLTEEDYETTGLGSRWKK